MDVTRWSMPLRYSAYVLSIVLFIVFLVLSPLSWFFGLLAVVAAGLVILGTWDIIQRKHTVSRNYPILAHFRYFLESIGPEIRQYFIQSDTEERPFSREQRTIVYQTL